MPIRYIIDHDRKVVLAAGFGRFCHEDVMGYQQEVWSKAEVRGYHELMDMTRVEDIEVPTSDRVRHLASLSASMDHPSARTRFAIIAPEPLAYGLGRMFETFRGLDLRSTKDVSVCRTLEEALDYLGLEPPVVLPE
jgi:hypothetical protein